MAVEAVCFVLREIPREPVLGAMWSEAALDASAVASITRRPVLDVEPQRGAGSRARRGLVRAKRRTKPSR